MFNASKIGCSLACATYKEGKPNFRNVKYQRAYWNGNFQGGCWEFSLPGALEGEFPEIPRLPTCSRTYPGKPATTKSPVPWHTRKMFVVEFFRACVVTNGCTTTQRIDGPEGRPFRFEFHLRFSEDLRLVSSTPPTVVLSIEQNVLESQGPPAGSIEIKSEESAEQKSMPPEFCDCPIPSSYRLPTDGSNLPDSKSASHTGANQGIKLDEDGAPKAPQCSKCNCLEIGKKKRDAFLQHWVLYKQNQEKNDDQNTREIKEEEKEGDIRASASDGSATGSGGQQDTQAAEVGLRAMRLTSTNQEETERKKANTDDDHRLLAVRPGEAVDAGPRQGQQQQEEQQVVQAPSRSTENGNISIEGDSSHELVVSQPLKRQRLSDDDSLDDPRDSASKRRKIEMQLALIALQLEETRLKRRQAELELQLMEFQQVVEVEGQA